MLQSGMSAWVPVDAGWRFTWHRWHYFKNGESLCEKFKLTVFGKPRRPKKNTLNDTDRKERVCEICDTKAA